MIYFTLFWLACAIILHGLCFAYWQNKFPSIAKESYYGDICLSLMVSFFGPMAIIVWLAFAGKDVSKYGFKLW